MSRHSVLCRDNGAPACVATRQDSCKIETHARPRYFVATEVFYHDRDFFVATDLVQW